MNYIREAEANTKKIIDNVNKFGFEPFASFGLTGIAHYRFRNSDNEFETNYFIGPYISYNPMNALNTSGNSLSYFSVGLMLAHVHI